MRRAMGAILGMLTSPSLGWAQQAAVPQPKVPIRALAAPSATTAETVGSVRGLMQLPNGRVLINDPTRHRLIVLDATLASYTVSADSTGTAPSAYPRAAPFTIYPFVADSSVIVDTDSRTFLVIDPQGRVGRSMAPVQPLDLIWLTANNQGAPGFDLKGRLIYHLGYPHPVTDTSARPLATRDTFDIVRADFESRRIDTVATVTLAKNPPSKIGQSPSGKAIMTMFMNPVPGALDDWTVLSDGSVAVVRGPDYHIDWLYADGTRASTPKMTFDWRRITDQEKQAKIDSARRIVDSLAAAGRHYATSFRSRQTDDGRFVMDTIYPTVEFVPVKDVADFVAPIRQGVLKPDRDGNLWILPTTSAQASGGLLYDVVNRKGEIFERVQLPKDRDIAGFGRGGVVYLVSGDRAKGYTIEKTQVLRQ